MRFLAPLALVACVRTAPVEPLPSGRADAVRDALVTAAAVAGIVERAAEDDTAACVAATVRGLLSSAADGVEAARVSPTIPEGAIPGCVNLPAVPDEVLAGIDLALTVAIGALDVARVCERDPQGAAYGYASLYLAAEVVRGLPGSVSWTAQALTVDQWCPGAEVGSP